MSSLRSRFDGEALLAARLEAGMSRAQLAESLKTDVEVIRQWETGISDPLPQNLPRVAGAVGRRAAELLSLDGEAPTLADLRAMAGLSQAALAEKVGSNKSAVSKIERGKSSVPSGLSEQYALALGVSVAELLDAASSTQREASNGNPVEPDTSEGDGTRFPFDAYNLDDFLMEIPREDWVYWLFEPHASGADRELGIKLSFYERAVLMMSGAVRRFSPDGMLDKPLAETEKIEAQVQVLATRASEGAEGGGPRSYFEDRPELRRRIEFIRREVLDLRKLASGEAEASDLSKAREQSLAQRFDAEQGSIMPRFVLSEKSPHAVYSLEGDDLELIEVTSPQFPRLKFRCKYTVPTPKELLALDEHLEADFFHRYNHQQIRLSLSRDGCDSVYLIRWQNMLHDGVFRYPQVSSLKWAISEHFEEHPEDYFEVPGSPEEPDEERLIIITSPQDSLSWIVRQITDGQTAILWPDFRQGEYKPFVTMHREKKTDPEDDGIGFLSELGLSGKSTYLDLVNAHADKGDSSVIRLEIGGSGV